jgi:ATP-dependent RNA helicase DeaD
MSDTIQFSELGLPADVLTSITELGYEQPSPIQARAIPMLLEGRDILGQAQTGTGKTAAFALPNLAQVDTRSKSIQVLVLTPTRELAVQVAEAYQRYARHLKGFRVLPIYGGQSMQLQLRELKRGVHVVVGTPGRIIDHLGRGTLKLGELKTAVLDEADEMLNMGFLDDVEKILSHLPEKRQIALFSATMPQQIERVAKTYLKNPEHIEIAGSKKRNENIEQSLWVLKNERKREALVQVLEAEEYDASIIFVRTRLAAEELTIHLNARGYRCSALQGDMAQKQRETAINALRKGSLDVLIATDVAARGLDVERISLVINYDIPYDVEAYVHRIGRTGRAGRQGKAVLFATPRERRMQQAIERHLSVKLTKYDLPTRDEVEQRRIAELITDVKKELESKDLERYKKIAESLLEEMDVSGEEVLAAVLRSQRDGRPLLFDAMPTEQFEQREPREPRDSKPIQAVPEGYKRYRLNVGKSHGAQPKNIVGAIANEANMDANHIGRIDLFDYYTLVDLPDGMPKEVEAILKKARVAGRMLELRVWEDRPRSSKPRRDGKRDGRRSDSKARGRGNDQRPPRRKSQ